MSKKDNLKKIKQEIYGNPNWINGRINRAEYFCRVLLLALTLGLSLALAGFLFIGGNTIPAILCFIFAGWMYWRITMAYVKRLHDLGWNGWLAVLILCDGLQDTLIKNNALSIVISLFIFVLSLFLLFRKGDDGVNKYGKDPLMKYEDNQ